MAHEQVVEQETVLPVMEEELDVSRRLVETGAVRVRKLVHEDVVDLNGQHVHDYIETERVPIGRVVQGPQEVRLEGDTMIVPILEERVVVHKELVLVEEVHLTRRREIRQLPEEVTLRRESAVVERLDPQTHEWHPVSDPAAPATQPPGSAAPPRD